MINRCNLSRDYGSAILEAQRETTTTISPGGAEQQQELMCSQRQMVLAFNS